MSDAKGNNEGYMKDDAGGRRYGNCVNKCICHGVQVFFFSSISDKIRLRARKFEKVFCMSRHHRSDSTVCSSFENVCQYFLASLISFQHVLGH